MRTSVLILCTGNTCRSQMAEGFLKNLRPDIDVFSAGTEPGIAVNRYAVQVMAEKGIDISKQHPKNADEFKDEPFDYLITVCDDAKEKCPVFTGTVKNRIHSGFPDPADAVGSDDEILKVYRKVRDQIEVRLRELFLDT